MSIFAPIWASSISSSAFICTNQCQLVHSANHNIPDSTQGRNGNTTATITRPVWGCSAWCRLDNMLRGLSHLSNTFKQLIKSNFSGTLNHSAMSSNLWGKVYKPKSCKLLVCECKHHFHTADSELLLARKNKQEFGSSKSLY